MKKINLPATFSNFMNATALRAGYGNDVIISSPVNEDLDTVGGSITIKKMDFFWYQKFCQIRFAATEQHW